MKLYKVSTNTVPDIGNIYEVYVIASDEKHAERLARVVYWNGQKIPLDVMEADMTQEMIVAYSQWYGR